MAHLTPHLRILVRNAGWQELANRKLPAPVATFWPTSAEDSERVLKQKRPGWRGLWQAQNWVRSLERYAFRALAAGQFPRSRAPMC